MNFQIFGIPAYFFCAFTGFVVTTSVYIVLMSSKRYDISQSMKILMFSLLGLALGAKIFGFLTGIYRNIGNGEKVTLETMLDTGIVFYALKCSIDDDDAVAIQKAKDAAKQVSGSLDDVNQTIEIEPPHKLIDYDTSLSGDLDEVAMNFEDTVVETENNEEEFSEEISIIIQEMKEEAMLGLSRIYINTQSNCQEAVQMLSKLISEKNGEAQYLYAQCLENGYGCTKDKREAKKYYQLAQSNGYEGAKRKKRFGFF